MAAQNNVNYNLYRCFVRVFEERNISRAAHVLQITQPTVTYNIKELERQLGVRLFYTHPRGVEPTRDAKDLYKFVCDGIASITQGENAIRDFTEESAGHIRIGVMGQIFAKGIASAIAGFSKIYPKVTFELVECRGDGVSKLALNNVDLAIVAGNTQGTEHPNLAEAVIQEIKFIGFASKFFAERHQLGNTGPDKLKDLPIVMLEHDRAILGKAGSPFVTVADLEILKALVREDAALGICLDVQLAGSDEFVKVDIDSLKTPSFSLKILFNKQTVNKSTKTFFDTFVRLVDAKMN